MLFTVLDPLATRISFLGDGIRRHQLQGPVPQTASPSWLPGEQSYGIFWYICANADGFLRKSVPFQPIPGGGGMDGFAGVPGVVSTVVPDSLQKVFVGGLPNYLNEEQVNKRTLERNDKDLDIASWNKTNSDD